MDYGFLQVEQAGTYHEPVAEYLRRLDRSRRARIDGRLLLLKAYDAGDPLPDPPFTATGTGGLQVLAIQLDVDEVHRIVFGARGGRWLLVHAFRDRGAAARRKEYGVAEGRWRRLGVVG